MFMNYHILVIFYYLCTQNAQCWANMSLTCPLTYLTYCRQKERQHCHNEDAKAEARGALHKTGSNAQQEYGYYKATHQHSVKRKSISLSLLATVLE
jgi:hypothetical protein